MATRQRALRIDDDLYERLRAIADGRPISVVMRRALMEYVERAEAEATTK